MTTKPKLLLDGDLTDPDPWPLPGYTYLTSPPTPWMIRQQEMQEWRLDRFQLIAVECWIEGYVAGEVSLRSMLRGVEMAANAARLPAMTKEIWMGRAALRALKDAPSKEGRSNAHPHKFKVLALTLVDAAHADDFTLATLPARGQPMTAYERAAQVFVDAGARDITARKLRQWREDLGAPTKAK